MLRKFVWSFMVLVVLGLLSTGCAKKRIDSSSAGSDASQTTVQESQDLGPNGTLEDESQSQEQRDMESQDLEEAKDVDEWEAKEAAEEEEEELALEDLREQVYFDFDSSELKSDARELLQEKAAILEDNPALKVIIEGHCDERGTQEYNLALGERRARAAYEFLILLGIDAQRLQIVSYGEERPAAEGDNEAAWAKNRRCEFKIYE